MEKIQVFSSVSISDSTDAGKISIYLTSNQPQSVIYDPNKNTYTPDWSKSNLVITPVIAYNGTELDLSNSNLTIKFQRQEGSGVQSDLIEGEIVSGNKLTVSKNQLSEISSGLIVYICSVSYTDSKTGSLLEASSSLTYSLLSNASDGKDAVLFQLYSPDGGIISNGEGSTTINTMMMHGTVTVSPDAFIWSKFENGEYVTLQNQTENSLVVTASMIDGTSWFKCSASYENKTYDAYWTVLDRSDPVKTYTCATVSQFENGKGEGAIYTRVYLNDKELDPIKSLVFSVTDPVGASSGDYYYHLDRINKLCILKKYNGAAWIDANEKDEFTYEYYRINSEGVELDTTGPYKTGKCFYIDPSIVQGNMQFRCKTTGSI